MNNSAGFLSRHEKAVDLFVSWKGSNEWQMTVEFDSPEVYTGWIKRRFEGSENLMILCNPILWALLKEKGAVCVNIDLFTKCFQGQVSSFCLVRTPWEQCNRAVVKVFLYPKSRQDTWKQGSDVLLNFAGVENWSELPCRYQGISFIQNRNKSDRPNQHLDTILNWLEPPIRALSCMPKTYLIYNIKKIQIYNMLIIKNNKWIITCILYLTGMSISPPPKNLSIVCCQIEFWIRREILTVKKRNFGVHS